MKSVQAVIPFYRRVLLFSAAWSLFFSGTAEAIMPHGPHMSHVSDSLFSSPIQGRHCGVFFAHEYGDRRYGDGVGLLGVFEGVDLKDLARSVDLYVREETGSPYTPGVLEDVPHWKGVSLPFGNQTSLSLNSVTLTYHDYISLATLANYVEWKKTSPQYKMLDGTALVFGIYLPIVRARVNNRYVYHNSLAPSNFQNLSDAAMDKVERLRAELFDKVGIRGTTWDHTGSAHLHTYLGFGTHADYLLRLRSLDLVCTFDFLMPTSKAYDYNNTASIPFGPEALSFGANVHANIGLKNHLFCGFKLGIMGTQAHSITQRFPLYQESAAHSPLVTQVRLSPGSTTSFEPFLIVKNILDNVHFTFNHAWTWHAKDLYDDQRTQKVWRSVFSRDVTDDLIDIDPATSSANLTHRLKEAASSLHNISAWNGKHWGVSLTYEPLQTHNDQMLNPQITVGIQRTSGTNNLPNTTKYFLSAAVQF